MGLGQEEFSIEHEDTKIGNDQHVVHHVRSKVNEVKNVSNDLDSNRDVSKDSPEAFSGGVNWLSISAAVFIAVSFGFVIGKGGRGRV